MLDTALQRAKDIESSNDATDTDVGHVNGLLEAIQLVHEWVTTQEG